MLYFIGNYGNAYMNAHFWQKVVNERLNSSPYMWPNIIIYIDTQIVCGTGSPLSPSELDNWVKSVIFSGFVEIEVDPCDPNPCLNDGTCTVVGEAPTSDFTCSCPADFTGDICETGQYYG